jgi:hypothetical protein
MTTETKFTQGKWSQSHREQSDGMYITQVYDDKGQSICDLNWHTVGLGCSGFKTDRKENAQLIAVAPEMYDEIKIEIEELQEFISTLNHMSGDWLYYSSRLDRKEALLAKARGE